MVWPSSFFLISSQVAAQVYTMLTKWLHPSLLIAPGLAFFWTISSDLAGLQCHSWFFNTLSTLASEELEPILKKLVLLNFDVNTNIKCISTQITWKLCCCFFFPGVFVHVKLPQSCFKNKSCWKKHPMSWNLKRYFLHCFKNAKPDANLCTVSKTQFS